MRSWLVSTSPRGERSVALSPGTTIVPLAPADARGEVRIATLLCAAIALIVVANLGRIPIFSTGERTVPILVNDLATAVLVAAGALAIAAHRMVRLDRTAGLALAFALVGGASAILSVPRFGLTSFELAVSLGYLARWLFYFAVYVVAINGLRLRDVERVWKVLEGTILVFAGFGIFQSIFLPDFAQLVYPEARLYEDWDVQGHRLVSTFLDPNFAGGFILIGLIVGLGRLAAGKADGNWKLLLLTVALVLTASRGSILAFVVGSGTILLIRGVSKRMLRFLALVAVLVVAALPKILEFARAFNKLQIDASALARVASWQHGLTVLRDHPVIGIGFNTWGFVQERYGWPRLFAATYALDGGLLFVAVMTGGVGLALFVAMLFSIASRSRRVWRRRELAPEYRGLAIGAAAMIPTIVSHSLFSNSLMFPYLMEALWVIWALVFVIAAEA